MFVGTLVLAMASQPIGLEAGLLVGRGVASVSEASRPIRSWYRVGPEIVGRVFLSDAFAVSLGLGYQAGFYDGADTATQRHEFSVRTSVHYAFAAGERIEHRVAVGTFVVTSSRGNDSSVYVVSPPLAKAHSRFDAFVSYGPYFRLSEGVRVGAELVTAYGPRLGSTTGRSWLENAEVLLRAGVEYRF